MIARLEQLVSVPSLSGQEDAVVDVVAAELRDAGLHVQRQGNNIWCEFGDQPRPRLLFNSHLDTVPAGEGWTGDPHTLRREGDRLIGLGANDAKGCVTAMIEAALALKARLDRGTPLGGTLVLALTAEEENSGAGLGTIVDQLAPLDAALVGEPTRMQPMIAQRGLLILRGIAHGRTAHPANITPAKADNAIMKAAEELLRLRDFDWGPSHRLLGPCQGHVTMISGGRARNVIPDSCEFFLDVRTTPRESHAKLFQRLCKHLQCELQIHSDRLVPVETKASAPIIAAVCSALPGVAPAGSGTMSDMIYLAGTPMVKIGPGDSPRSHTPNEYICADELAHGASGYELCALAFFERMARNANRTAAVAQTSAGGPAS